MLRAASLARPSRACSAPTFHHSVPSCGDAAVQGNSIASAACAQGTFAYANEAHTCKPPWLAYLHVAGLGRGAPARFIASRNAYRAVHFNKCCVTATLRRHTPQHGQCHQRRRHQPPQRPW